MSVISVIPVGPFNAAYSYFCDRELPIGTTVEVPFGRRCVIGVVTDDQISSDMNLKTVAKVFNFNIGEINCAFLKWVSDYTLIPKGNVLKMMLAEPSAFTVKKNIMPETPVDFSFSEIKLNADQTEAFNKIMQNGAKPFLLNGVTGSGKTEIYLSAVKNILRQKKQALILLPEIALTGQTAQRIEKYFGIYPDVWNSHITPKNKRAVWIRAVSGEPCFVVGARSALFIPFTNLGIIVADEEHDSSYKQEEGGFYNARDMAVVRGYLNKIPVILSSATPSAESCVNAENGKYGYAFLQNRFGPSRMPSIELIDMRQNRFRGFISPVLLNEIKSALTRREQCLIYLNRRGYAPAVLCKSCGEKIACPNCSVWLVYHKSADKLLCHHCNYRVDIPKRCSACGTENSCIPFGPGVERIFEELTEKLPTARIDMISSDIRPSEIKKLLNKINNNETDIVIGTQILAKGHHFPNITLVGIADGDLGLNGADLRTSERTYQLINQMAGRAGRAEKPGKILIQTFNPEHSLYSAVTSPDPRDFIKSEIESRRRNKLPPFSRFASIIVSGTDRELTERVARDLGKIVCPPPVKLFGPAPAAIFFLRGRVRWRLLLKTFGKESLGRVAERLISSRKIPRNVKIQIDVDPISFF
ncbi:MAG: primosomal protein N' [Holosporaceae bacterium]|jgi:primosomal protein N' (replication factor Y)|nr:primosomal protein N' [Holosporaceae bacterium]